MNPLSINYKTVKVKIKLFPLLVLCETIMSGFSEEKAKSKSKAKQTHTHFNRISFTKQ